MVCNFPLRPTIYKKKAVNSPVLDYLREVFIDHCEVIISITALFLVLGLGLVLAAFPRC